MQLKSFLMEDSSSSNFISILYILHYTFFHLYKT